MHGEAKASGTSHNAAKQSTLSGKLHHKRSAQTNSAAMRQLLELFSAKNQSSIQNTLHTTTQRKEDSVFLAGQLAALTDVQLKQKRRRHKGTNTVYKKGSGAGAVASSALILAPSIAERPAESSLGLGKKYRMVAASTLGSHSGGTFFLPSKVQGYKQRYHKNEELCTLNRSSRKKKKAGHFSKQVLRQLVENDPHERRKAAALALRRFSVSQSLTVDQRSITESSESSRHTRTDDYAGFSSCPSADDRGNPFRSDDLGTEMGGTTMARKPPAMTSVQSNRIASDLNKRRESVSVSLEASSPFKKCGSVTNNDLLAFALRQRRQMRDHVHTSTEEVMPPTPLEILSVSDALKSHINSDSEEIDAVRYGGGTGAKKRQARSPTDFKQSKRGAFHEKTADEVSSPLKARGGYVQEPQRLQKWLGESGADSCSDGSSIVMSLSAGYSAMSEMGHDKDDNGGVREKKTPSRGVGDRGKHLPRTPLLLLERGQRTST